MQLVGRPEIADSSAAEPRSRRASTSPPPKNVESPSCRQLRRVRPSQFRYCAMAFLSSVLKYEFRRVDEGPQQIFGGLASGRPRLDEKSLAHIIFLIGRQPRIH